MNRDMCNVRLIDLSVHNCEVATNSLFVSVIPVKDLVIVGRVVKLDMVISAVCDRDSRASKDEIDGVGHETAEGSAIIRDIVLIVGVELDCGIGKLGNTAAGVVEMHEGG